MPPIGQQVGKHSSLLTDDDDPHATPRRRRIITPKPWRNATTPHETDTTATALFESPVKSIRRKGQHLLAFFMVAWVSAHGCSRTVWRALSDGGASWVLDRAVVMKRGT